MSRALITLASRADRERAIDWIEKMATGTRVEFKKAKRSLDQNSKMWASLTDLSTQLRWHGAKLSPADWKLVLMDGLKREARLVPNMDNSGFVNLGQSSSDLSKEEMSELLELIMAFGAQHDVAFRDQMEPA